MKIRLICLCAAYLCCGCNKKLMMQKKVAQSFVNYSTHIPHIHFQRFSCTYLLNLTKDTSYSFIPCLVWFRDLNHKKMWKREFEVENYKCGIYLRKFYTKRRKNNMKTREILNRVKEIWKYFTFRREKKTVY